MITIDVFMLGDKVVRLRVTGHSQTAPYGQDIVCAGISALTQAAVLGLSCHLKRKLSLHVATGELDCALDESPDSLSEAIWRTMLLGLAEIAKLNPKSVRIKEHRR